jgi:perosamine synthetase
MLKINKIPISEPFFFGGEKKNLVDCINSGWVTTSGKYIELFKKKIKSVTKSKHVSLLINCTSALQMAIRSLNPDRNQEILVPSMTFVASVNAIFYNNCKPIFMDCDDEYLLDINKTKEFIQNNTFKKKGFTFNKKTKKKIIAIIIVHAFGNCIKLDKALIDFFKKHKIKIIEDAAGSLGSYIKFAKSLKHAGSSGDIGCISFNGNKIITSGGGGAIITNDEKIYKKINYLSNQSKNDVVNYKHDEIGYNMRMSNLNAAVGYHQLVKLKHILKKKKKINANYSKNLSKIPGLNVLTENNDSVSNNWINILKIDPKKYGRTKSELINFLSSKGVETRSIWFPNHLQKSFLNEQKYKTNKSEDLFNYSICLPSSYSLTNKDILYITNSIKSYVKKN